MPYLEKNRVGRDAIDSAKALIDMGKYLYQERRLPTYDIAFAITKYVAEEGKGRREGGGVGNTGKEDNKGRKERNRSGNIFANLSFC